MAALSGARIADNSSSFLKRHVAFFPDRADSHLRTVDRRRMNGGTHMTAENNYPVVDPDNVPETICLGTLNVAIGPSGLSTITFTHTRPKVGALFESGEISNDSVVRARIVTTTKNLVALREIITSLLKEASDEEP
jgi:hypothetical protein